jgi:hypothetical protein
VKTGKFHAAKREVTYAPKCVIHIRTLHRTGNTVADSLALLPIR